MERDARARNSREYGDWRRCSCLGVNVCQKSNVFLFKNSLEIANGESASPSKPISYQNPYSLIQQSVRRILEKKTSVPRGIPPMTQVNLRLAGQRGRQAQPAEGERQTNPAINAGAPALTPRRLIHNPPPQGSRTAVA